ncbi:hypothetical protein P8452_63753 [Trifolium repens]|jgi:hypothetical protein|nr:hypothetical protein P8452_16843 [Trifolium repens]WJX80802.1 hypothetical protein P8452_63753 [Trifolium repens]
MDEAIDTSKSATAKARSIRRKILQHKRRFRQLKKRNNNANVSALHTTPSNRPLVSTTPHMYLDGLYGFSQNFNIGSSSLGFNGFFYYGDDSFRLVVCERDGKLTPATFPPFHSLSTNNSEYLSFRIVINIFNVISAKLVS